MMAVEAEGTGANTQAKRVSEASRPEQDLWPRLFHADPSGPLEERLTPGTGSALRWIFSSIWLVYLIPSIADLFERHHHHYHSALYIGGGLVIAAAFCAIYAPVIADVDRHPVFARYGL